MDRIAGAIVAAALLIAASIYLKPSVPRFTLIADAQFGQPYRLDNRTGQVDTCSVQFGCKTFFPAAIK